MVLAGDHNVFHAGIFGHLHPGLRVVFYRVKLFGAKAHRQALFCDFNNGAFEYLRVEGQAIFIVNRV